MPEPRDTARGIRQWLRRNRPYRSMYFPSYCEWRARLAPDAWLREILQWHRRTCPDRGRASPGCYVAPTTEDRSGVHGGMPRLPGPYPPWLAGLCPARNRCRRCCCPEPVILQTHGSLGDTSGSNRIRVPDNGKLRHLRDPGSERYEPPQ